MGTHPEGWAAEAETEATRAIAVFEELGDERGLAEGWSLLGLVGVMSAQFGPAEEAWERAATYASRAGVRRDELESLAWIPLVMWAGPTPVDAGAAAVRRAARAERGRQEGDLERADGAGGLRGPGRPLRRRRETLIGAGPQRCSRRWR